jgi:hypothetical protein
MDMLTCVACTYAFTQTYMRIAYVMSHAHTGTYTCTRPYTYAPTFTHKLHIYTRRHTHTHARMTWSCAHAQTACTCKYRN